MMKPSKTTLIRPEVKLHFVMLLSRTIRPIRTIPLSAMHKQREDLSCILVNGNTNPKMEDNYTNHKMEEQTFNYVLN